MQDIAKILVRSLSIKIRCLLYSCIFSERTEWSYYLYIGENFKKWRVNRVGPSTSISLSRPVTPQWDEWISESLHLSFSHQGQASQVEDMLPCLQSKNLDEASSVTNPKACWGKPTILCTYIPESLDIRGTAAVHWGIPTKLPLSVYNSHEVQLLPGK